MKKNVMMRIASILLVCVLASTCGISGTFAKYVTEASGSATARVAKWGVEITSEADTFGHFYFDWEHDNGINTTWDAGTSSVASGNGEKVIAPGTKGSMVNVVITGTPEVDANIKHVVSAITFTDWEVDTDANGSPDTFYCPLVFKIGANEPIKGYEYVGNKAGLINEITKNIVAEYNVEAGTNLATAGVGNLIITWEWPFELSDLYNKYDTYLGDRAAGGYASSIEITVTTTVTQRD